MLDHTKSRFLICYFNRHYPFLLIPIAFEISCFKSTKILSRTLHFPKAVQYPNSKTLRLPKSWLLYQNTATQSSHKQTSPKRDSRTSSYRNRQFTRSLLNYEPIAYLKTHLYYHNTIQLIASSNYQSLYSILWGTITMWRVKEVLLWTRFSKIS